MTNLLHIAILMMFMLSPVILLMLTDGLSPLVTCLANYFKRPVEAVIFYGSSKR